MTSKEYLASLKRLGLGVSTQQTQRIIGVTARQLLRYSAGDQAIPVAVERLLFMLERHGIPPEWR